MGTNVPIAFLGDNPQTTQWANYELDPHDIKADLFQRGAWLAWSIRIENIFVFRLETARGRVTKTRQAQNLKVGNHRPTVRKKQWFTDPRNRCLTRVWGERTILQMSD